MARDSKLGGSGTFRRRSYKPKALKEQAAAPHIARKSNREIMRCFLRANGRSVGNCYGLSFWWRHAALARLLVPSAPSEQELTVRGK
jgi:hypothetical protein